MSIRRVAGLLATLGLLLAGCSGSSDASPDSAIQTVLPVDRKPAPVLAGESLQGSRIDVGTMRGKPVVVNFWASWCSPCRAEAATLKSAYEELSPRGVEFVGVDIRDERAKAAAFERKHGVPYASIWDQSRSLVFGKVPRIPPSTVVLDRQGRLAALVIGQVSLGTLRPLVESVLAEPA